MVSYPNQLFEKPSDNKFFIVSFLSNDPEPSGLFEEAQDYYSGIFQIDICRPLNETEKNSELRYKQICKVFYRGATFGDIEIKSTPSRSVVYKDEYFCTTVRVVWEAYIDKE